MQLPIAVAAVRNGVQTVLCNCYPFLETKGGGEGKRLLASLHEVRKSLRVTAEAEPRCASMRHEQNWVGHSSSDFVAESTLGSLENSRI